MHHGGRPSLDDLDWLTRPWNGTQAYSDSKLLLTTFAATLARRWTDTYVNAVDPGWVPTGWADQPQPTTSSRATPPRCGSPSATNPKPTSPAGYWYHQQTQTRRPPYTTPRSRTRSSTNSNGSPGSRSQ